MRQQSLFVFVLLIIFSVSSFGEELADEEISNTKEEYMLIFNNIPVLFEYLLVALEDKPEILETDNPMAFNDVKNNNAREFDKRDVSNSKEAGDKQDGTARIADDIFDKVEGLDDPESEEAGYIKDSSEDAETDESVIKITPQEIAEKFLMVEQMLEDFNKS